MALIHVYLFLCYKFLPLRIRFHLLPIEHLTFYSLYLENIFYLQYIVCQTLSLCIIFIAAIMSFIFFDNLTVRIRNDMISTMENYHNLDWATESWDNTQRSVSKEMIKKFIMRLE